MQAGVDRLETAAEGFEAFYVREYQAVVRLAYALSGSRLAAEDIAQDAFLRAFRDWDHIRQPFALRYVADASVAEIAQTLGLAEGTVKAQLHRGRPRLPLPGPAGLTGERKERHHEASSGHVPRDARGLSGGGGDRAGCPADH